MFSRFKIRMISFALSLMLILICSEAVLACNGVYRFMSEMQTEDNVSKVDRMIYDACSSTKIKSIPSIKWNEMSKTIFWPPQESQSKEFIITNKDMPEVVAILKVLKKNENRVRGQRCNEFEISIAGKTRQLRGNNVRSLERRIRVQGLGMALICQSGSFPRAASMQLKRTIEPTLWSSLDHKIEEEIEIAWSVMP